MFRFPAALGLLLASFIPLLAADPEPKEFASKEGKYKATFPAKVETKETKGKDGKLTTYAATAQPKPGSVYTVSYFDFDKDIPEKLSKDFLAAIAGGIKGKAVSDKEVTFGKDKLPAREAVYELPKVFLRQLIILDGRRVYQVIVAGPNQDTVTSKDADKFVESFQITK